jgi:hypothetical protein
MWGLAVVVTLFLYIRLAIWIAKKLSEKRASKQWKWGVLVCVTLVFVLIPTWDSILGQLYFNHLCSTEAGVKVYQMMELPAEYWDEAGKAKFYDEKNGNLRLPLNSIKWESRTEKYPLNLEKNVSEMKETHTGKILNERILFTYWGGWVARNFSPHNTAVSCGSDVSSYTNYVMQIFKPSTLIR